MSDAEVRLINANSFKRFLQALCKAGAPYEYVIQLLDKEPTAYDVAKVVAEIEEDKFKHPFDEDEELINSYIDRAIKAVRKGGVD